MGSLFTVMAALAGNGSARATACLASGRLLEYWCGHCGSGSFLMLAWCAGSAGATGLGRVRATRAAGPSAGGRGRRRPAACRASGGRAVLGQHAAHRAADQLVGLLPRATPSMPSSAGRPGTRCAVGQLVRGLVRGEDDLVRVDHDHVVAGADVGRSTGGACRAGWPPPTRPGAPRTSPSASTTYQVLLISLTSVVQMCAQDRSSHPRGWAGPPGPGSPGVLNGPGVPGADLLQEQGPLGRRSSRQHRAAGAGQAAGIPRRSPKSGTGRAPGPDRVCGGGWWSPAAAP